MCCVPAAERSLSAYSRSPVSCPSIVSPVPIASPLLDGAAERGGGSWTGGSISAFRCIFFCRFSGGKVRGEGVVLDISMGGCIIESQAAVHVDDIFYLQIALDKDQPPLEVAAMVRSVSSRGIAFKFLRAAQENQRLLAFVQAKTESLGSSHAAAVKD